MASEVGDLDINGCILSPVSGTMMVKGRIAAMRRNRKSNAKKDKKTKAKTNKRPVQEDLGQGA